MANFPSDANDEDIQRKGLISNAVAPNPRAPWRNSLGQLCFQNVTDLNEFSSEVAIDPNGLTIVIVIDNDELTDLYPDNKHYYAALFSPGSTTTFEPLTRYIQQFLEEWPDIGYDFSPPLGSIKLDTYKNVPVYVPDPNRDDNRPETQVGATTSKTTGNTVVTTTTAKIGTIGVVTESEVLPAPINPWKATDAIKSAAWEKLSAEQRTWLGSADPTDPYIIARASGINLSAAAKSLTKSIGSKLSAAAKTLTASFSAKPGVKTGIPPCLPANPPASQFQGSGATPQGAVPGASSVQTAGTSPGTSITRKADGTIVYDIRQGQQDARVSAYLQAKQEGKSEAEAQNISATVGNNVGADALRNLPSFSSDGSPTPPSVPPTVPTGGASQITAPTTVTTSTAANAAASGSSAAAAAAASGSSAAAAAAASGSSAAAAAASPQNPANAGNVYIYEALRPGFDRYDFNTGKKLVIEP